MMDKELASLTDKSWCRNREKFKIYHGDSAHQGVLQVLLQGTEGPTLYDF